MIQRCTNCGSPIAQGQRFCGNCGAQLTVSCPYCRITLSPPTKFCPNCGAALGGGTEQAPGWGAQPTGQPAPPGWGQQQPGWGQQQPGWGQQPVWTPQQAQPAQPSSSSRPFLVLLLIILLLGLGGLAYFGINQFGWGDTLKGLLSSVTGGAGGIGEGLKISEVKVVNIGVVSAEIMWETNKPASTQVDYWITSTDIKSTQETDIPGENSMGVYAHSVKLTGLEPGTKYYFKVKSRDKDGQLVTGEGDFTTQEMPAD